jgi:hypothetical protein
LDNKTYQSIYEFFNKILVIADFLIFEVRWQLGHLDGDVSVSLLKGDTYLFDELLHLDSGVRLRVHKRQVDHLDVIS